MPLFRYQALGRDGKSISGEMDGPSAAAVIERLQGQGWLPISAVEALTDPSRLRVRRVKPGAERHWGVAFHKLASLLEAGMPLDRGLTLVAEATDDRLLRQQVQWVMTRVQGGASLSEALSSLDARPPQIFIAMVRAGEAGGSLDVALHRLSELAERNDAVRGAVRSALVYPMVLLAVMGLSLAFLFTVVLPQFGPLFEQAGDAVPWPARMLLSVGETLRQFGGILVVAVIGLTLGLRRLLATPRMRARSDRLVLRLPLVGRLVRQVESARFARTLGLLLTNGVPLAAALGLVRGAVVNGAIGQAIANAALGVKEGRPLSGSLAESDALPSVAVHFVRVGEETGNLEGMLLKLAEMTEREAERTISHMLSLLVPLLTIVLGLVVGAIVASIFTAIMSVNEIAL